MKALSVFLNCLLLFAAVLCLTTCSREYSYEGGPAAGGLSGTAIYRFLSASGSCTGSQVNGIYFTATPLDTSNWVLLQVDVTMTGSFRVTTATINGMQFSATGNFSNAGVQSLKLNGTGQPAAEGLSNMPVPGTNGCSFPVSVARKTVVPAGFTLAGSPGNCENFLLAGTYSAGVSPDGSNLVALTVNVTGAGPYSISTDTVNGMYFSGAGTFNSIGNQQVRLAAHGSPAAAGLFLFRPAAPVSACTFPVPVQNTGPFATYVLESGGGMVSSCVYILSGNLSAGTPLSSANTINMSVYVTATGNYTISTGPVNGITFSASGSFTATGQQRVILTGSGMPQAPGSYPMTPQIIGPHPLGGQVCAISVQVN